MFIPSSTFRREEIIPSIPLIQMWTFDEIELAALEDILPRSD
jgi:hypothetical protein